MTRSGSTGVGAAAADDWPAAGYSWYVTWCCCWASPSLLLMRQVLNLLVEPIRADLQISDTQISFLQGLAFVLTYVLMSVPIGRLVDKFNRIRIMVGGILVWSLTTVVVAYRAIMAIVGGAVGRWGR